MEASITNCTSTLTNCDYNIVHFKRLIIITVIKDLVQNVSGSFNYESHINSHYYHLMTSSMPKLNELFTF
jgi:hypothetical protein